jgi:hypothetical protein
MSLAALRFYSVQSIRESITPVSLYAAVTTVHENDNSNKYEHAQ